VNGALSVPLDSIVADDANQPRMDHLDEAYIDQLADVPELWPPIVVVATVEGRYTLVDGFHRYRAAEEIGLHEVPATVIAAPADGDLASMGFDLNSRHGRPLSLADRRAQAERLLRKDPAQSDRELSRRCGIAPGTVARIRRDLEGTDEIEHSADRVGADGRMYAAVARLPGELPDPSLGELVSTGLGRLFSPPDRREMRKTVHFFKRLSIALNDQYQLNEDWQTPEDAATACVEILGPEKARDLAHELAPTAKNVVDVCRVLLHKK
jgi:hypothetical protein